MFVGRMALSHLLRSRPLFLDMSRLDMMPGGLMRDMEPLKVHCNPPYGVVASPQRAGDHDGPNKFCSHPARKPAPRAIAHVKPRVEATRWAWPRVQGGTNT
jgi:hypothetical protein